MQVSFVAIAALLILASAITHNEPRQEEPIVSDPLLEEPLTTSTPEPVETPGPVLAEVSYYSDYVYPGSEIKLQSEDKLELTSYDNSDDVTDWYKDLIKEKGFNTKSFVTTKVNGQVTNELEASNGEEHVEIKINKKASEDIVYISIRFI